MLFSYKYCSAKKGIISVCVTVKWINFENMLSERKVKAARQHEVSQYMNPVYWNFQNPGL